MSKRRLVGGIIVVVIAVISIGLWALLRWSNGPADGTLRTGLPTSETPAQIVPEEPVGVDTDYFTAQLPSGFKPEYRETTPGGSILLQMTAISERQQLGITIGNLPSDGLNGVGGYNLRVTDTKSYQPYYPDGMPAGATAFQTVDGPSAFVVYWPKNKLYAEIAFSSDSGLHLSELLNSYEYVAQSWEWR